MNASINEIEQGLLLDFGLRASILTFILVCNQRPDGAEIRQRLFESWRSSTLDGYQKEMADLREQSKTDPILTALYPNPTEIEKEFVDAFDRVSGIIEKMYEGADVFSEN